MKKMKKLFVLLSIMLLGIGLYAQTYTMPNLASAETYIKVTTDYVATNTTAVNLIFPTGNHFTTTQDYLIQLDSTSGNQTNVAVALYGAKFATSAYSAIGSAVNWKGSTGDTTIVISNATAARWRYFKIVVTGTGTGTTTIDTQELKLYQQ
jgi:uncharacterized protein YxeA